MTEKRNAVAPVWLILVAIAVLGVGILGIVATGQHHADVSAKAAAVQTKTVRIPIEGMICTVCAGNVKKALKSVPGVQEAEISLERREAVVRYGEGKVLPEQLVSAINQLGYKAGAPLPDEAPR
jgi:copper chaperone CopZ